MGFEDYAFALKFRQLIEDIAGKKVEASVPIDTTMQVVSIDYVTHYAGVKQAGDDGILMVKFSPSLAPRSVGSYVRVSGYPGNYYISAILDEPGIHEIYEETDAAAQAALDAANAAIALVTTDTLPPSTAPVVLMSPLGFDAVTLTWNSIPNADPVKYRVYFDKVLPPTMILDEGTSSTVMSTSTLPNGQLLDSDTIYYAQVIPYDADGDGPASAVVQGGPIKVPAGAVSEDILVVNELFTHTGYFGEISVNQLTTGTLTATVDITTGKLTIGQITLDQEHGFKLPLPQNGQIVFPIDGSDAIFEKVRIHATGALFDDSVEIRGQDNLLFGRMQLVGTVPPPSFPPQAVSVNDQAPLQFSITAAYAGIGDNGTRWQSAATTANDGNTGIVTIGVFAFDKASGTRTTSYTAQADFYAVGTSFTRDDGIGREGEHYFTDFVYGPSPTPGIVSFHSNATISVVAYYLPAYTYQQRIRVVGGISPYTGPYTTSTAQSARYNIVVMNNTTGAVISNFTWSTDLNYAYPAVFTDGTFIYAASTYSNGTLYLYRYSTTGTGFTQIFATPAATYGPVNLTGLWIGQGDFGAGQQRCIVSWSGAMGVFTMLGVRNSTEEWTAPEFCRGVIYSGTSFYMHGGSSKLWKASTIKADATRSVKYTWYDSVGTVHESIASPAASVTQSARRYLQIITSPAPYGGAVDDPNTVRVYIDGHRQADVPPGLTTIVYETPNTANPNSPSVDGFSAIGGHGSIESTLKSAARVQQVTLSGGVTGGTFVLTYSGSATTSIAYNATATTVQAALNALLTTLGAGSCVVGGGPGPGIPWVVSFSSVVPAQMGFVSSLSGSGATITISDGTPVAVITGDGSWHFASMAGIILPYAGDVEPNGFWMTNGQAISRIDNADLYRVIGTRYGAGDGSTTFNVPDLRGRVIVCLNAGDPEFDTLNEIGGSKNSLQSHTHTDPVHSHSVDGFNNFIRYAPGNGNINAAFTGADMLGQSLNLGAAGGGQTGAAGSTGSQNLQPFIVLNYVIKT